MIKGVYEWNDGKKYEGTWKNNNMEGKGKYFYNDGRIYEGMFHNNLKDGFGIFYWPEGRRYEGNWLKGKPHGKGKYFSKGKIKVGIWKKGVITKWISKRNSQGLKIKAGNDSPINNNRN